MKLSRSEVDKIRKECENLNGTQCHYKGVHESDKNKKYWYYKIALEKEERPTTCFSMYKLLFDCGDYCDNENKDYYLNKSYEGRLFKSFIYKLHSSISLNNFDECIKIIKDYNYFVDSKVLYSGETVEQYETKTKELIVEYFKRVDLLQKIKLLNTINRYYCKDLFDDDEISELIESDFIPNINKYNVVEAIDVLKKYEKYFELTKVMTDGRFMKPDIKGLLDFFNRNNYKYCSQKKQINDYFAELLINNKGLGWDIQYANNLLCLDSPLRIEIDKQKIIDTTVLNEQREYNLDECPKAFEVLRNYIPNVINEFINVTKKFDLDESIKDKINNIDIVLSNEEIKKHYDGNEITIEEFIKLLKSIIALIEKLYKDNEVNNSKYSKLLDFFKKILKLLLELSNVDKNTQQIKIEELADEVFNSELFDEGINWIDDEKLQEAIIDLLGRLKSRPFDSIILGSFSHENDLKITLYLNSIKESAINHKCYIEAYVLETFSHELFHAIHYLLVNPDKWDDDKNDVSIESLASYFEYKCIPNIESSYDNRFYLEEILKDYSRNSSYYHDEILDQNNLVKSWMNHSLLVYPYSGAKYMNLKSNLNYYGISSIKKDSVFRYIFNLSLKDLDETTKELFKIEDILTCK